MNPPCRHQWRFSGKKPHGDDRVIHTWKCSLCHKTRTKNLKKPRFVPYAELLERKSKKPRKKAKTSQKPPECKRKAIRKVSDKRKGWLKQYEAKKREEGDLVTAWDLTGGLLTIIHQCRKEYLEPHHPLGRLGCRVLFYRWTTPTLHEWIHKRADWAREQGLILPEMSGRESKDDQPDPFHILPEYRAYVAEHGLH